MSPRAAKTRRERGIILPSVLIVLALASAVVMLMLSVQDIAIQRSRRFNEAAQAGAYVRGGELSVIAALRRDGVDAPETDNFTESWAAIAQAPIAIENGSFALAVRDAQARFNVNTLAGAGLTAQADLERIVAALRLPAGLALRIAAFLKAQGPLRQLGDLVQAGLSPGEIAQLAQMAVALPGRTLVNVNTAEEALIGALLANAPLARQLTAQRERRGFLTAEDVAAARAILPAGLGYTSNYFEVETRVRVGDTAQGAVVLLQRSKERSAVRVIAISRSKARAAPFPAPPLKD